MLTNGDEEFVCTAVRVCGCTLASSLNATFLGIANVMQALGNT